MIPASMGIKGDPLTIWRPSRSPVVPSVCQPPQIGTVYIYSVDMLSARSIRDKGNPFSIRRPSGPKVSALMVCQATGFLVSGVHHVDVGSSLIVGLIGKKASIRRPTVRVFICVIGWESLEILTCAIYEIEIIISFVVGSERDCSNLSGLSGYSQRTEQQRGS
jgi:hypothetical protein